MADRVEELLEEVIDREGSLKKISVSVAAALLTASMMGSVVLYKEFVHVQEWAETHEKTAAIHINRIGLLEEKANEGGRWTLEYHNEYAKVMDAKHQALTIRISTLERKGDLTEFKLEAIDNKLDEIISAIQEVKKRGE